jgi:hypothetical protein
LRPGTTAPQPNPFELKIANSTELCTGLVAFSPIRVTRPSAASRFSTAGEITLGGPST